MSIETPEQFTEKLREHYVQLLRDVGGRPMEFTEVLAKASFWMRIFHDAYGNDPAAMLLFEAAIADMQLGTTRIPLETDGKVH